MNRFRHRRSVSRCLAALAGVLCAAPSLASGSTPGVGHVDIVIVAGQSNARPQFAEGVSAALDASDRYDEPEVFHRFHSGNKIREWVAGSGLYEPGPNYLEDFWSPEGDGDLQQRVAELEDRGLTWDIVGFVWFQGEADSAREYDRVPYPSRFLYMLNALEFHFGLDHDIPFVITLIDYNGDEDALANAYRTPEDIELTREMQQGIGDDAAVGAWIDSRPWPRLDLWHVGEHGHPSGVYAPSEAFGSYAGASLLALPVPRSRADMDANGQHDLRDLMEFVSRFSMRHPAADLAAPLGRFDLGDIDEFLRLFTGSALSD
jgi:hypothetical protein